MTYAGDMKTLALELATNNQPLSTPEAYYKQRGIKTIGVRGTGPGCGKDTVADMIMEELQKKSIRSIRKRFATALKQTVSEYTGIPGEILETVEGKNIVLDSTKLIPITPLMVEKTMNDYVDTTQQIKPFVIFTLAIYGLKCHLTEVFGKSIDGRTVGQVLQLLGTRIRGVLGGNAFVDAVFNPLHKYDIVVISDVRYKQENEAVKNRDGIVVFVKGGATDAAKMAGRSLQHSSERDLDGVPADFTIENNGTLEELKEKVKVLINQLFS